MAPAVKVRKALDETGDVVFESQTITDVITLFKTRLKVDVQGGRRAWIY